MSGLGPGRAKTAGGEVSSGVDVCGCDCKNPAYSSPLWRLDGSRVRAGRTSNGGTALEKRHSHSQGYVFIAAISGPGPMMLMTRVR
jgi:hypothetical protein